MKFKRALSLLLVFAICSMGGSAALAYERQAEYTPVIVVPGYSGSLLHMNHGTPEDKQVWGLDKPPGRAVHRV